MPNNQNGDDGTSRSQIDRTEKIIALIERLAIVICIVLVLLSILGFSEMFDSPLLAGGIAIIAVLILVEFLLVEKRRYQR
ncbi:MAG: hypothetical protein QW505_00645 [Thermoplasmata archaeon]